MFTIRPLSFILCLLFEDVLTLSDLTAYQLSRLQFLKESQGCRTTKVTVTKTTDYFLPWFCVRHWECTEKYPGDNPEIPGDFGYPIRQSFEGAKNLTCRSREFFDHRTSCCFVLNLEAFSNITAWEQVAFPFNQDYQKTLNLYANALTTDRLSYFELQLFSESMICSIQLTDGVGGFPLYNASFCVIEQHCNTSSPKYEKPPKAYDFCKYASNPYLYPEPTDYRQNLVCCPVAATVIPHSDVENAALKYKIIPSNAKFAPGFRSTFQCELYSRFVCEGSQDNCPYRFLIFDHKHTYPLEGYHQALVGVRTRRSQIFHCQGSLVSRYFILSALECSVYRRERANIALLGEYDTHTVLELHAHELFTYISEHHYQRAYLQPDVAAIVLFKLWRAVEFSSFRRPACINYQVPYNHTVWNKPGSGVFTGYGAKVIGEGLSSLVKKFLMQITPSNNPECYSNEETLLPQQNELLRSKGVDFCANKLDQEFLDYYDLSGYESIFTWGPCEFDLGGPLASLLTVPYCQLLIMGVLTLPVERCPHPGPFRFRALKPLLGWLEDTLYNEDFYSYDWDMHWPICDLFTYQFVETTYLSWHAQGPARKRYTDLEGEPITHEHFNS